MLGGIKGCGEGAQLLSGLLHLHNQRAVYTATSQDICAQTCSRQGAVLTRKILFSSELGNCDCHENQFLY